MIDLHYTTGKTKRFQTKVGDFCYRCKRELFAKENQMFLKTVKTACHFLRTSSNYSSFF